MLESLLDKIAGLQACNFIKKILQERCFPVNFARILRTAFLQNTSGRIFWLFYILKKTRLTQMSVDFHILQNPHQEINSTWNVFNKKYLYNRKWIDRSSHQNCSLKKLSRIPQQEKQLCWSLFLIKLQAFRSATLLWRDPDTSVFLCNLWNF